MCGPAAYAFDLMRIIFSSVVIDDFKYTLLARRPDLLDIPLDALNSVSNVISAIDIVNYILERQLLKGCDAPLLLDDENGLRPSFNELISRYDAAVFDDLIASKSTQTTSSPFSPPPLVVQSDSFNPSFYLYFETQCECLKALNSSLFAVMEIVVELSPPTPVPSTNTADLEREKNISHLILSSGEREQLKYPTPFKKNGEM